MAEVEIKLKTKSGTYYTINRFNGLKSVESTSQSLANPSNLTYGLLANTGTATIIDVDGEIKEMIESGELSKKGTETTIYVNGNQVQQHITSDSDYSIIDKTLKLSLTNDVEKYYDMYYKFPAAAIKTAYTLESMFGMLSATLNWTEGIDYALDNLIYYNQSGEYMAARDYLRSFTVKNPYFLKDNVGYVIDTICQVAQLCAIKDKDNRLIFVNAVPKRCGNLEVNDTRVIRIPRKMQTTLPQGSLFGENQIDAIEYSEQSVTESISPLVDKTYTFSVDGDGNLMSNDLGPGAQLITGTRQGHHVTYACFFVTYEAAQDEAGVALTYDDYLQHKIYPFSSKVLDDTGSEIGGGLVTLFESSSALEDFNFATASEGCTELVKYKKSTYSVFAVKVAVMEFQLYGTAIDFIISSPKTLQIIIRGHKYLSTYQANKTLPATGENGVPFNNNELTTTDTIYADINLGGSENIYEFWQENTISTFNDGIRTLKLSVFCSDFYGYNLVGGPILYVDYSGSGKIIEVGQNLIVDIDNSKHSAFKYADGTDIVWRVTGRTFRYAGAPYVDLELQEVPPLNMLPKLETPTISLSGNSLTISKVANATGYALFVNGDEVASGRELKDVAKVFLPYYISKAGYYTIAVKARAQGYSESGISNSVVFEKLADNQTWVLNSTGAGQNWPASQNSSYTKDIEFYYSLNDTIYKYNSYIGFKFDYYENVMSLAYKTATEDNYVWDSSDTWSGNRVRTIVLTEDFDETSAFGVWLLSNGTKQT